MRASPVPLLQGPRVSFETESSASHAHPLTRTVTDRLCATGRPRGVWPAPGTRVRAGPCCSAGPGGARVPGERAPHGALRPERPRTRSAAPLLLETLPPSHPLWFGLQSNYPSEQLCNPQVTCIHPASGFGGSPLTQSPEGRKQARARAPGPLLALCRGLGVRLTRGWMEGRTDGRTEGWMDG